MIYLALLLLPIATVGVLYSVKAICDKKPKSKKDNFLAEEDTKLSKTDDIYKTTKISYSDDFWYYKPIAFIIGLLLCACGILFFLYSISINSNGNLIGSVMTILLGLFLIILYIHGLSEDYPIISIIRTIIIFGLIGFLSIHFLNKTNEKMVRTTVETYARMITNKDVDNLQAEYIPSEYINKNYKHIKSHLDELKSDNYHYISLLTDITYIEEYKDVEELKKTLATNGISLNIKKAYTVYVYYQIKYKGNTSIDTIPVIVGKVYNKWYIIDDNGFNKGHYFGLLNAYISVNKLAQEQNEIEQSKIQNNIIQEQDEQKILNKFTIKGEPSVFVYDEQDRLTDEEEQSLNDYIIEKQKECDNFKVYILFPNTNDIDEVRLIMDKKIHPIYTNIDSLVYSRTQSDNMWYIGWSIYNQDKNEYIRDKYTVIGDAYFKSRSTYNRCIDVIDKAYEVYLDY
ncbi:MAG: hypothetical protein VZS44_09710 [Bacilli bacterium]|nr:hypothetical protein [Bacilli bacterium]